MNNENTGLALRQNDQHSIAMQIMFDDKMFERVKWLATQMAKADGFTPKHLIGKTEACFAVLTRSMTWGLDPFAVMLSTYQTPGGAVGFEGKLCHAILERSNRFNGRIKIEHFGDWSKVQGKFTQRESKKTNKNGEEYSTKWNAPSWQPVDEIGLGVKITATLKGEVVPITFEFLLVQAQPRNSTLWATDPRTQLGYLAIRRFANSAVPDIFMGLPFDEEYDPYQPVDVTPPKEEKPVKEKKQRREATETNEILKTQAEKSVADIIIADLEEQGAKMEFAPAPAELPLESPSRLAQAQAQVKATQAPQAGLNQEPDSSPARKRMEEIRNVILETKTPNQLRDVIQRYETTINLLPDGLETKIYDTLAIQKEKLGMNPGEDLFSG